MRISAAGICGFAMAFGLTTAHGAARLDKASVRAFIIAQDQAWERRDFGRYYSTFDNNAVIVTVQMHRGVEISRSLRTIAGDRQQARRFFATHRSPIHETDMIQSISVSHDGKEALVRVKEVAEVRKNWRRKTLNATTEQNLALRSGRLVSLKLTEYDER